jgi:hypothetical protein
MAANKENRRMGISGSREEEGEAYS